VDILHPSSDIAGRLTLFGVMETAGESRTDVLYVMKCRWEEEYTFFRVSDVDVGRLIGNYGILLPEYTAQYRERQKSICVLLKDPLIRTLLH
jgi:hypothetical protein